MIKMFSVYMNEAAVGRTLRTLESGYLAEGPVVKEFENKFRDVFHIPCPVAVNSGTSAIHLALILADVKAGDEVITTPQTMLATSQAILVQQATPVFADIQYETGNIDPEDIEHRITEKTKAILVVHWAGYPCDLARIHEIAKKHNLPIIEDAAHALGATYNKIPIGDISQYTCFSFQAVKHITTGDGGMLCLNNQRNYVAARRRRWYGLDRDNSKTSVLGEREWMVEEVASKFHMNDMAASVGVELLDDLGDILKRRNVIAYRYWSKLKEVPGITMFERQKDRTHANWLFSMHVERRLNFIRAMRDRGVDVSVVHTRIDRHPVFGGKRLDLPNMDRFDESHICLPLHMGLSDEDIQHVIDSVKEGW